MRRSVSMTLIQQSKNATSKLPRAETLAPKRERGEPREFVDEERRFDGRRLAIANEESGDDAFTLTSPAVLPALALVLRHGCCVWSSRSARSR